MRCFLPRPAEHDEHDQCRPRTFQKLLPVALEVVLENDGPAALGGFCFLGPQTVITSELIRYPRLVRNNPQTKGSTWIWSFPKPSVGLPSKPADKYSSKDT